MLKFECSNDQKYLADVLKKDLFNGSIFDRRLLILPSDQIKLWLTNKWLEDGLEVVSGVEFSTLQASIPYLLSLIKESETHFLSALELKLLIIHFLNEICESKLDPVITSYLSFDKQQRLIYLSEVLSNLFQNYSVDGAALAENFKNPKSWQEILFNKIFYKNKYSFPLNELPIKSSKKIDLKIYLFSFTYLPELYFDFLYDMGNIADVFVYYPRMTSEFWEDVQSVKQKRFIQKKYLDKCHELQDWTLKMFETNSFLAQFGGLGKRYEKILGNYNLDLSENYFEKKQKTLLSIFQNHILTLNELENSTQFDIEEDKNSICVQVINGSKLEEVKTVYEEIQNIFISDRINHSEILVIAPNINEYLTHIKTIFGRENGSIDFKINDIELLFISHLAKGLEQIFSLIDADWTLDEVLSILDNPLIQAKFQVESSDIEYLQKILKKSKLRFSYNEKHKNELLGYFTESGTWEDSFNKIVMSYAIFSDEYKYDDYPQLFSYISQSDLQKIEPFFQIITSLYNDLVLFNKDPLKNIESCISFLNKIVQKYFLISDDPVEAMAFDFVQGFCLKLKRLDQKIVVSLQHFRSLLTKEFRKKTATLHSHLCNAVQFGSLGHDKWHPFEHVFMMGMHNDAFPTSASKSSLDLLKDGLSPTKMQFERFAFLSAIVNAKKSLWISYPIQAAGSDKSNNLPSLFIKELSEFLNKHYKVNGLSFAKWNQNSFAKGMKKNLKKWNGNTFLSINYPASPILDKCLEISTYDLMRLARNPIGFYLQKKHSIKLSDDLELFEEDFFMTPLNKAIYIQEEVMSEKRLNKRQLSDLLPIGIFQDIAVNNLSFEIQNFKKRADDFNIDLSKFIDIELSAEVTEMFIDQKKMYLPAIAFDLENKRVHITGRVRNAHPNGLVLFKENSTYEWIKNWPVILIFSLLAEKNANFSKDIYFLKSNIKKSMQKIDISKSLKEYLRYYLVACENVFPFSRSFIPNILKNDLESFYHSYNTLLTKKLTYQDPFEKWFARHFSSKINPSVFSVWADYLNHIFNPLTK